MTSFALSGTPIPPDPTTVVAGHGPFDDSEPTTVLDVAGISLAAETPPGADMGEVRRALAFGLLGQLAVRFGTFGSGLLFAHLLVPQQFGTFAVALVVASVITNVNDLGLVWTLVRSPGSIEHLVPTATTVTFGASGLLYAVTFAIAGPVARAMHAPHAAGVLQLLAVSVLIDAASAVPASLLTRSFQQGKRAIADIGGLLVSTGVTAALAVQGHGAWSLAWGRVAGNTVSSGVVFLLAGTLPRPGWNAKAARELLRFGLPTAGSALFAYALLNVDYVVVGHRLGPVQLGIYVLAFNLASWPVTVVTMAVRKVSVAAFGRLAANPEALRAAIASSFALAVTAVLPLCLGLSLLAEPLVATLYGGEWIKSSHVLSALAILGGARVLVALLDDALQAAGHPRAVFVVQGAWFLTLIPVLSLAASHGGLREVGIAHAIVASAVLAFIVFQTHRLLGVELLRLGRPLVRPVVGALVAGSATWLAAHWSPGGWERLLVGGFVLVAVYGAIVGPATRRTLRPSAPPAATPVPRPVEAVPAVDVVAQRKVPGEPVPTYDDSHAHGVGGHADVQPGVVRRQRGREPARHAAADRSGAHG